MKEIFWGGVWKVQKITDADDDYLKNTEESE